MTTPGPLDKPELSEISTSNKTAGSGSTDDFRWTTGFGRIHDLQGLKVDLHTHTTFSDGRNTPEEIVQAAIEAGLHVIGFADHSYTPYDDGDVLNPGANPDYLHEAARLKEKYADQIRIFCGIEQDYLFSGIGDDYDYSIGSVHYLRFDGIDYCIDMGADILLDVRDRYCGGDVYRLIEAYYQAIGDVADTEADIVGHFDYIKYYNEDGSLFNDQDPRYVKSWQAAADRLLAAGKIFEINYGGMTRKNKSTPYPSREICEYITARGGQLIRSSDSHKAEQLAQFYKLAYV